MSDLLQLFDKPFDALLTAVSILTATAGWMYSAWLQRQLARRAHTLDILLSQDTNTDLAKALNQAEAELREIVPPRLTDDVRRALNFYDFMCSAARDNTLDSKLMIRSMRYRLLRMYHIASPLVMRLRVERGNAKIAEDFEWFVTTKLNYRNWANTVDEHGNPNSTARETQASASPA